MLKLDFCSDPDRDVDIGILKEFSPLQNQGSYTKFADNSHMSTNCFTNFFDGDISLATKAS